MAALRSPSLFSASSDSINKTSSIFDPKLRVGENELTYSRALNTFKTSPPLTIKASKGPAALTKEALADKEDIKTNVEKDSDLFVKMKRRFLSFKRYEYLESIQHYQNLAKSQSPKFMVIACADSRVCPSAILGFKPGEAFIVRNVANLVPPYDNGPTETNAALEFAVTSLEVESVLVIGHSCCGGIRALMSMQPEEEENSSEPRSFIKNWVVVGRKARVITRGAASDLNFDQQCQFCEKESINHSLLNLLTYPWIEERVTKGSLSLHGGYYDFRDCTFEKWTLDCKGKSAKDGYSIKGREFWS